MKWSPKVDALRRGISLAAGLTKAKLHAFTMPRSEPLVRSGRLTEFNGFGDNPARLRMHAYLPALAAGRPLVVLLHGCGQDAGAFAHDSGWTDCADRLGFPLILPQQTEANNAGRCFQWFQPGDTARDAGEAGSIAEMIRAGISRFDSDPRRIFVVGLSAGGAMAAALLAAYPDLFAAGASVAGLPVGAAHSGRAAVLRMASAGRSRTPEALAAQVRAAAPRGFAGPWPRLSVWQGQGDMTVAPDNGALLASQWCALHHLTEPAVAEQPGGGIIHQVWRDRRQSAVELWSLRHLPHAYPVGSRVAVPGRFMAQTPVDATAEIARFFGLEQDRDGWNVHPGSIIQPAKFRPT